MTDDAKPPLADGAIVIHLRPDEMPITRGTTKKRPNYCQHNRTIIDAHNRILECKTCGADLDPYEWINRLSIDAGWVIAMRAEKKSLGEEIETLKAERDRLKAARRRAGDALYGPLGRRAVDLFRETVRGHRPSCNCVCCRFMADVDAAEKA